MLKIFFPVLCLSICILASANEDLLTIQMGMRQANNLLFPKNGRKPLKRHVDEVQFILDETTDLFTEYKKDNPSDRQNISQCAVRLNGLKTQLLPEKPDLKGEKTIFLG